MQKIGHSQTLYRTLLFSHKCYLSRITYGDRNANVAIIIVLKYSVIKDKLT